MFDICPASDYVSQPYGCVDYTGEWLVDASVCPSQHFHAGIDLGSTQGGYAIFRAPVFATRPGVVVAIGTQYLGPFAVTIESGGVFIEHGHLDETSVQIGQQVAPGDQLGLVGTQGASTAPHLHVEVRTDGPRQGQPDRFTVDPTPYLNREEEEMAPLTQEQLDDLAFVRNLRGAVGEGAKGWPGKLDDGTPLTMSMAILALLAAVGTGDHGWDAGKDGTLSDALRRALGSRDHEPRPDSSLQGEVDDLVKSLEKIRAGLAAAGQP